MKDSRSERLSDHLLEVDEALLENAQAVDSAEKLKAYRKKKAARGGMILSMTPTVKKLSALAACLVLVIGIALAIPSLIGLPAVGGGASPEFDIDNVSIESIDSLNYYCAVKMLSDPSSTNIATGGLGGMKVLAADQSFSLKLSSILPLGADAEFETSEDEGYDSEDRVYYELSSSAVFTVKKVIFFRVELVEEKGFLASRIGTGTVDVVITDNSLEPMITFKNGDNYYSCLINSESTDKMSFSSHKYIEGFNIVKDSRDEIFAFEVDFNTSLVGGRITSVKGVRCEQVAWGWNDVVSDGKLSVVSKTYISDKEENFTVGDLQKYFGAENPKPVVRVVAVYTDGGHVFKFYSDGSFTFNYTMSRDYITPDAPHYRKGSYEADSESVTLNFFDGDELMESTRCEFAGSGSFRYDGTSFANIMGGLRNNG